MPFSRLPLHILLLVPERLDVGATLVRLVIVHNHLMCLVVTFPRCEHHSTGILQHGDDERDDKRLRKEVFCCAEQPWTLPIPVILLLSVISPMTLP